MKLLAKGAEANLYLSEYFGEIVVVKKREEKKYRIPVLDIKLRKKRTKNEASLLHAAKNANVLCPIIYSLSDFDISMSYIQGTLLRDLISKNKITGNQLSTLGMQLAMLHNNSIIHGDFTTANVMVDRKDKVWIIDFGLGSFSRDIEDKAVDLLLMKTSLENEKLFQKILSGYQIVIDVKQVLRQIEEIEKRARYVVRAMEG